MPRWPLFLICLAACRTTTTFTAPLPDDGTFVAGAAADEETRRFKLAAAFSASHGGLSMLVLKGDKVLFEEQQNGNAEATPHHLFSGTKSFSCALAAVLAEDGTLDLDAPASDVLEEWKTDAKKSKITIRHLLAFTSGLDQDWWRLSRDGMVEPQSVADKYAFAAALPAATDPGSAYVYGSSHLMAFGAWVKKKTGKDPLALLEERVFSKIGVRTAGWNKDPAGNAALPYGAWTTAREWAKFGVLVRNGGVWKGTRVLPEARLKACFEGSSAYAAYGLTWWLNNTVSDESIDAADSPLSSPDKPGGRMLYAEGPADLVAAAGYNDQRLYVIPSLDLVIVRTGTGDRKWRDGDFLARVLDGVER